MRDLLEPGKNRHVLAKALGQVMKHSHDCLQKNCGDINRFECTSEVESRGLLWPAHEKCPELLRYAGNNHQCYRFFSKNSFASLTFVARYGLPPRSG